MDRKDIIIIGIIMLLMACWFTMASLKRIEKNTEAGPVIPDAQDPGCTSCNQTVSDELLMLV